MQVIFALNLRHLAIALSLAAVTPLLLTGCDKTSTAQNSANDNGNKKSPDSVRAGTFKKSEQKSY